MTQKIKDEQKYLKKVRFLKGAIKAINKKQELTIQKAKQIIGNMILEFDDDFDKIKSSCTSWTGSCVVNANIATELRKKITVLAPLN